YLSSNASGKHVDAVSNRLCPDIRDTWNVQLRVEPLDDAVFAGALGPLGFRFEDYSCFSHVGRRGVSSGFRAPDLADHHFHRRIGGDDAILLAHDVSGFGKRDPRVGDRHKERRLFVKWWHELGTD